MKKTFKFFAAALAIVAAASCAKEISNDDTQAPEQELVHKVFTASFDADTKTTLADDGLSVHWLKDDVIKVIPAGSQSGSDFSVVSCNETFADFEGETVDADSYRAIYPSSAYREGYSSASTFAFSNGSAALSMQYAVEGDFSIAANFGVSSNFAVSQSSKDGHLYFQNINAFLKIQLSMDNASVVEVSSNRVTAYPNSYMLSSAKDLGGTINYVLGDKKVYITSDEIITFKTEDASDLKSGVEYYIAIPAVEIEGLSIVIKDKDGGVINTYNRSRTLDAVANTIYDLGILEPKPAAKVGDYFYSDGTYSTELDSSKEAVGVVFYVGDPTEEDAILKRDYPYCTNGLVVGLKRSSVQWLSETRAVYEWAVNNGYHTLQQFTYDSRLKENKNAKYKWGYNNTSAIREYASLNGLTSGLVSFADSYSVAVEGASSWYIPSIAEMQLVRSAGIKSKVQSVGGDSLSGTSYYTSSEENSSSYIPTITFEAGSLSDGGTKRSYENVFAIFAF